MYMQEFFLLEMLTLDVGANFARVNCRKIFVVTSSTDRETLAPALDEIHERKSLVQSHRGKRIKIKERDWDHYLSMIEKGEVKEDDGRLCKHSITKSRNFSQLDILILCAII